LLVVKRGWISEKNKNVIADIAETSLRRCSQKNINMNQRY